ncbi:MAG: hypothetical protein COA44_11165 [Arcobacter sp.]|nr:MAG: hypothetical protein COA44_11165 [Arcobacter sp.]
MKTYMNFSMKELKRVASSLNEIKSSIGAKFEHETKRLLQTISSKKANDGLNLKVENLERLSMELHGLEVKHGISLGETIYHFMHSFHRK